MAPDALTRDQAWQMKAAAWGAIKCARLGHDALAYEWARLAAHWAGVILDATAQEEGGMTGPDESLMMLVASYCKRRGWIPVGRRAFSVGEWHVRVNGSRELWDGLAPWHVLAEHARYVGMLLFSPGGGTVGGYRGAEEDFRAALVQDALAAVGRAM